ncbi:tetratricopeptide repeat protein [Ectothiorhodospira variabilis]|uniref:tetratricopeptide repeat protein n=1 Tax=Ectothiorhodospira variabilis TaxID=505694 RepID=UPI001EFA685B|nr:tetratricopeptide repeat protein [Ectothiorhodospira variabilis]MCG5494514.1 sel1 repeat family protein [Ectothiorhodospira variabilis]MCG5503115.1 sel1 repeat family protein [Ectothiorhodospira variabilis]MCG5506126.1 sel1 repeat family protein [Ectothiorhodospira variabilis]
MPLISVDTAVHLTGLSKRTIWRRMALEDGSRFRLRRPGGGRGPGPARIELGVILKDIPVPDLQEEEFQFIQGADSGDPEAQNDVALMLLEVGRPELALFWFQAAADQEYPDAMHWLGRCYVSGEGVPQDEALGVSWIKRAAQRGHRISQGQVEALGLR